MRMKLVVPASLLFLVLFALVPPAPAVGEDLVTKWLANQAKLKTLTAEFTQERRLREGRRPIVTQGNFTYAAPGSFRWQMGQPAATLAVQKNKGALTVANVRRKRATVYPVKVLKQEEQAMGFAFIETGFPKSAKEFFKNFTIKEVETKNGIHHVTVTLNDKRASMAMRKMIFHIGVGTYDLHGFYLRFRDSSSITTRFKNTRKNPKLPAKSFEVDLSGYKTETKKAKK